MEILNDKSLKAKEKVDKLSQALTSKEISVHDLIAAAANLKEAEIANVMEAFEYFTNDKKNPGSQEIFDFAVRYIEASAPRLKWESAKVVGNIVSLSMRNVDKAVSRLLVNTEDSGTVVRWSAAYALGEILKINVPELPNLRNTFEAIITREGKNSIKKIYLDAIKKWEDGAK